MTQQEREAALQHQVERLNRWLAQHNPKLRAELVARGLVGTRHYYALRVIATAGPYQGEEAISEMGTYSQTMVALETMLDVWATAVALEG